MPGVAPGIEIPRPKMKVPTFVIGSSLLLTFWLGATFVRDVPVDTYPKKTKVTPEILQTQPPEVGTAIPAELSTSVAVLSE